MEYVPLLLLVTAICGAMWLVAKVTDRWGKGTEDDVARIKERWAREDAEWAGFRASAKRLQAKIVTAWQFGLVNLKPNLQLSLRVEDPDGPYDVDMEHHVEFVELPDYREGRMVDVLVDAKDKKHVVVTGLSSSGG